MAIRIGRSASFAVALAGVACASRSAGHAAAATPKQPAAKIEVTVPGRIAGFQLSHQERYENRDFGTMYRYQGTDSMFADVFVYPGPALGVPCDTTVAVRAIETQVAGFREGFPVMIQRHYVDEIAVVQDDRVAPGSDDPWCAGRHLTLDVIREGIPKRSDFYLYALPGYFVKVRMTFVASDARLALEQNFIAHLFPQLVPNH